MSEKLGAQLLARGVQDIWLSGYPQVSFYRSRFKRHAPFALTIERFLVPNDGKIVLNPKSDLIGYTYLTAHNRTTGALVPNAVWSNIVSTVELVIGNQTIATHDLTYINTLQKVLEADTYSKRSTTPAFQPLGFFFDRQPLPIAALRYTDVRINITWASTAAATQYLYRCWSQCVHLGEDERRFFATQRHQMLIPQIQRVPVSNEPFFRGPLKYIAAPCLNYANVYSPPSITGGTLSTVGGYKVHTFNTTGPNIMTVTGGSVTVQILIVAGGGGSGDPASFIFGGGGGGGVYYTSSYTLNPGSYTVNVGNGGGAGYNGQNSNIYMNGSLILYDVPGGGGGLGISGGSGGGGNFGAGGLGISPFGYNGGSGSFLYYYPFYYVAGGGGGGAGGPGGDSSEGFFGGNGGNGRPISISGSVVYYGAGRGGLPWFGVPGADGLGANVPNSGSGGQAGTVIISEAPP